MGISGLLLRYYYNRYPKFSDGILVRIGSFIPFFFASDNAISIVLPQPATLVLDSFKATHSPTYFFSIFRMSMIAISFNLLTTNIIYHRLVKFATTKINVRLLFTL